jgi:DNA repair exonuclease SbcCD ATPase subunit
MLELKTISWQNFLSYGDYVTTLQLDNLGQCIITGEVIDDKDGPKNGELKKSNGAGKSTIPNVIQWVLFGRTMHSRNPGNNIVNWHTGKNCWAKLEFKNGDSITRTRNTDGKNELIYYKDGDERRLISDTIGTATLQQQQLNKDFDLDWELFCGSVFFNQYGKPWMELADTTRRKAIERILHVDRFTYYAMSAKDKCDNLDKLVSKLSDTERSLNDELTRLTSESTRIQSALENNDQSKQLRIDKIKDDIAVEQRKHDEIVLPDLDVLKVKWELVKKIKDKLDEKRAVLNQINTSIAELSGGIRSLENRIDLWVRKSGKVCTSCEQSVDCTHTDAKVTPLQDELKSLKSHLDAKHEEQKSTAQAISFTETLLKERTPAMTLLDAQSIHNSKQAILTNINRLAAQILKIKEEVNPHTVSLTEVTNKIGAINDRIEKCKTELVRSDLLNKHYHYVYKAYNDRNKIKSYVFKEHVPFINQRLKHYLDTFGLDVKITLNESLGIDSNMWGYEFESGGERKRTDVAFMLAMFDFHEQMYGRQCNILVLDEVDGRMDDDGIDALINIIKNDLASRVETVMVISHRSLMFDTFPKEIKVVRSDRNSVLEVI